MTLPYIKESIKIFCLLLISVRLDIGTMFIFLILLYNKQCMTTGEKALWLVKEK